MTVASVSLLRHTRSELNWGCFDGGNIDSWFFKYIDFFSSSFNELNRDNAKQHKGLRVFSASLTCNLLALLSTKAFKVSLCRDLLSVVRPSLAFHIFDISSRIVRRIDLKLGGRHCGYMKKTFRIAKPFRYPRWLPRWPS